jgi:hypothetical protein
MYGSVYEAGPSAGSETGRADVPGLTAHAEAQIRLRIRAALGPDADPAAAERLEALYTSAILSAGQAYAPLADGPRSVDHVAHRILNRH